MQHHQTIDHGDERVNDVLDPDDRHAGRAHAVDQLDQRRGLVLDETAGDLVKQQHARPGGERAGELKPLAVEQRQRARAAGWPCPSARSVRAGRRSRRRPRLRCRPPPKAAATTRFSNTVMPPNGCGTWNERAIPIRQRRAGVMRVTSWPSKITRPAVRRNRAGDDAEQRGLAGAVRPDDAERLAAQQRRSIWSATTTAPKRLEIFSRVRIEGIGCGLSHRAAASGIPAGRAAANAAEEPRLRQQLRLAADRNVAAPGSFAVMTSSNLSPLRCHWPATSGVLVTFFTGFPVHCTGPTIDW